MRIQMEFGLKIWHVLKGVSFTYFLKEVVFSLVFYAKKVRVGLFSTSLLSTLGLLHCNNHIAIN